MPASADAEADRLRDAAARRAHWKRWGPYLSERAWGTVREDYSADGDAWHYFPHDHARSRAYRWNEDGLAGICDRHQLICFALALWNGRDPILKERLFGLTGPQGNHGEDVKEYYFYLDSTPTHSYMKWLYKYPQAAFPYARLVEENARRGRDAPEFELLDTGVFDGDRYFDVFVEYAKASVEDILIRDHGRKPRTGRRARIDVLPTIWFRNTLVVAAGHRRRTLGVARRRDGRHPHRRARRGRRYGRRYLYCDGAPELLFTEQRDEHRAAVRHAERDAVRQGRHPRVRRPRQHRRGESGRRPGPSAPRRYRATVPGGGRDGVPPAADRRARSPRRSRRRSTRCSTSGSPRPTSSTRRDSRHAQRRRPRT